MPSNKRITDLRDYTFILPYASEMFGVYQPMIGWNSKRIIKRHNKGLFDTKTALLQAFTKNYKGISNVQFDLCNARIEAKLGALKSTELLKNTTKVLLQNIKLLLPQDRVPVEREWKQYINEHIFSDILTTAIPDFYKTSYHEQCEKITAELNRTIIEAERGAIIIKQKQLEKNFRQMINEESALAASLLAMVDLNMFSQLEVTFYRKAAFDMELANQKISEMFNTDDPFATFDPKKDIKNVNLSPLGIVHLFRQYFFELDTFLGTPTGHVWLSPGSSVELVEVSTRRTTIEKSIEQSIETTHKKESSSTEKDEFSLAVKDDNKKDTKLGASLTVHQSWGTGDATATGSINQDETQSTAREFTHKRMREQSEKLSSEIKENYKSTFKTITETTDTSSKRYVLNNTGTELINYELRRKMRQVGVQVQDIGSYLCWQTFIDEPGRNLGLANLVHIAKPADLVDVPVATDLPVPPDQKVKFSGNVVYTPVEAVQMVNADGFLPLTTFDVPTAPEGYEVKFPNQPVGVFQMSGSGEGFNQLWAFRGRLIGSTKIEVGPDIVPGSRRWDVVINFVVGGEVEFTPTAATKKTIADANKKQIADGIKATNDNNRKTEEAFITAAKERIELASNINTRKYEDLREEERIIVYRNLISALMGEAFDISLYETPSYTPTNENRHTISELINSIFDINKMLYFVAPEWWKPRRHYHQNLGVAENDEFFTNNLTNWSDLETRPDNYFITEKSAYAKMGSSLGWLLQLDGDDLRNAFLNAPWVKAVIPIRPGKELQATNWLQQMNIEGTDGLTNEYYAKPEELEKIKAALSITHVTIADAIKYLCAEVAAKHKDALKVARYPEEEINDENRVNATPVDKVYEHGFYPLKGGFRAVTGDNYEVFDQWIEVLPTDQVVPVEVKYDPRTGIQVL